MKKIIQYIKHSIFHKISFWKWKNLRANLIEYGPAFLIIIILVEIIEHIGLPFIFYYLGNNIHEFFYVLIPAPLIICFHFITAPFIFFIYIKIMKRKKQKHVS